MIVTKKHLSRRTVLRGMGAALALPFLDSMVPAFGRVSAAAPVRRFGAIYVGNGMNMLQWTQPEGQLKINPITQALEPFRDRISIFSGLDSKPAVSNDQGQHPRAQAAWLTGCRAKKTNFDVLLGTSLDQIIALQTSKETQLGSLELTVEPTDLAGDCGYGFGCAYNNTIAWRTPTTPLPMENNPRNVFERLFGASDSTDPKVRRRMLKANSSVLDSLSEQVQGLNSGFGPNDKRKLAEYLDAVRDAERRIQKSEEQLGRSMPVVEQPGGMPPVFEDYVKLMFDLQLLAFQTDMTRVFTLVLARESSIRSYPEIGVADSHHPLSHHQNDQEKLTRLAKINAFHLRQLAYFTDKLSKTVEGDGTMLDGTMVLYGAGLSDSNLHIPTNVPTLLMAGKNFGIKGDRFLQYSEGTPLSNLQFSIAEKFGAPVDHFGDSNGELTRLTGV